MENKDFSSPTTLQSALFSRNGQIVHVDAFANLNYNKDFLKFPETYFNTDEKISTFPLVSFDLPPLTHTCDLSRELVNDAKYMLLIKTLQDT